MDRVQIAVILAAAALIIVALLNAPSALAPRQPAAGTPAAAPTAPLPPPPAAQPPAGQLADPGQKRPGAPDTARQEVTEARVIELSNDAVKVRVSTLGGRIDGIELAHYADRIGDQAGPVELVTAPRGTLFAFLGEGPFAGLEGVPHEVVSSDELHVELRVVRDGVEVTRRITLDDAGYGARLKLSIRNRGSQTVSPRFDLAFYGQERDSEALDRFQNYSAVLLENGTVRRTAISGIGSPGFFDGLFGAGASNGTSYPAPVEWAGIDCQYFLLAAIPESPRDASGFIGPLGRDMAQAVVSYPAFEVPPQTGVERSYRLFMGPKVTEEVIAVSSILDSATVVGWAWVRPLVNLFAFMLRWTHDHVLANYGVAIILLTIVLRLLTFPLTQRSMKSMRRFSLIAPEMKAIQEKHADDRPRMQEELMKLYRQKGMNPLSAMGGGCIPMLIQMPFMIALYFALQSSIDLRHAPFAFWINDLSAPEHFLSVAGLPIRVLPLLMGASMVLQQKLTPTPSTDPQQKQMMQWMSVMFIFLFYQFPSGLVLYWFVSNLLGIAQQLLVNRAPAPATA